MMDFCMKSPLQEKHELIVDGLKCTKNQYSFENTDQLQENCSKINLPTQVIRSSSLTKISHSFSHSKLKNDILGNQKDTKNATLQNSGNQLINKVQKRIQNTNQKTKKSIETSTKQIIFNKLLQKNQISTKAFNNINNKQNHNQKQKVNLPSNSFYHKHQNVDKLTKLYKEKQEKQLQQCTFNPKISVQNTDRNYDTKEFYKNQIEHSQQTFQKIQQLREIIKSQKQKQNTFKPKLSKETIELTQRRANHNVYERLYHKKNQNQEQTEIESRQCDTFRRNTSKKSITLVTSSKKRNQKSQSKQKKSYQNTQFKKQLIQSQSKELKSQRSLKKFHEMFEMKEIICLNQQRIKQDNYSNSKRPKYLSKGSHQNSENKKNFIDFGPQKLDCQALFQQKRQSENYLSRQQSCKLLNSVSNGRINTSKHKYEDKQWIKNKDGLHLKNKTSQKTLKIALQKFVKELFVVSSKIGLKNMIDLNQMVQLLRNLNFIQNIQQFYESPSDAEIKVKVFEIWTLLQGTQSGFIFLENLLKILCAIQGFTNPLMIDQTFKKVIQCLNLQQSYEIKQLKSLVLSQKDSKMIKKDFMNFYLTRFRIGESKLYVRQLVDNQFTFHPTISKESHQYAEKYREKIIQESQKLIQQGLIDFNVPQDGFIDHSTLLILDQKIKDYKLQQKRINSQKQKIRKENQSMQSHSISNRSINQTSLISKHKKSVGKEEQQIDSNMFSRISHNESQSRSKDQIFTELYEQGRRSKSNRRDKSTEQVEYESNKGQLTFKPKLNQAKVVSQFKDNTDLHQNIPNFTKQIMRMRSNKNLDKEKLSISPLLYLNVTMQGNSQTKIPVYQSDTFQEIVEKVRIIMKIQNGEEQKSKLKNILKEQIIPVLDQLGIREKEGRFFAGK